MKVVAAWQSEGSMSIGPIVRRSLSLSGLVLGCGLVVGLSDFLTIKPSDYRHTNFWGEWDISGKLFQMFVSDKILSIVTVIYFNVNTWNAVYIVGIRMLAGQWCTVYRWLISDRQCMTLQGWPRVMGWLKNIWCQLVPQLLTKCPMSVSYYGAIL